MKKEEIFEMTKHLDEKYILEAAPKTGRNIKMKKKIITFAVAAAITASLSIGSYATYKAINRDSVGKHYDSSTMDKMEQSGYVYNQQTENKNFRFTLETALKDDWGVMSVITVKPLSKDAEKYMKCINNKSFLIRTNLSYLDTGEKIKSDPYSFELFADQDARTINGDYSLRMQMPYKSEDVTIDPTRPLKFEFAKDPDITIDVDDDLFDGLSLETKEFKESKNVKLYTDNDTVMNISEFAILVSGFNDEEFLKERENLDTDESIVYFKDGTSKEIFDINGCFTLYYDENNKMQEFFDLGRIIDPETVDYVVYAGHTYKRK